MASNDVQLRAIARLLASMNERIDKMDGRLSGIESAVLDIRSEQLFLDNRVENTLARAMRANIRIDETEGQTLNVCLRVQIVARSMCHP